MKNALEIYEFGRVLRNDEEKIYISSVLNVVLRAVLHQIVSSFIYSTSGVFLVSVTEGY